MPSSTRSARPSSLTRQRAETAAPTTRLDPGFVEIGELIGVTRLRAMQAVNSGLIDLYWQIGAVINRKIDAAEWGESVVAKLAAHIDRTQPGLTGYTRSNLYRMRQFHRPIGTRRNLSRHWCDKYRGRITC